MARTPAEKLQIRPGTEVLVVGARPERRALLDPLPERVDVVDGAVSTDVVDAPQVAVLFAADRGALEDVLAGWLTTLTDVNAIWIAYPKGNRSDINRDSIWRRVQDLGWTLVANVSLGDVWSAVRAKPVARGGR